MRGNDEERRGNENSNRIYHLCLLAFRLPLEFDDRREWKKAKGRQEQRIIRVWVIERVREMMKEGRELTRTYIEVVQ